MTRTDRNRINFLTTFVVWFCWGIGIFADEPRQVQMQPVVRFQIQKVHQIDQLVWGAAFVNPQLHMEYQLANTLYDLGSQYELTDEQKGKLKLAGQIESKRFMDEFNQLRRDFDAAAGDQDQVRWIIAEAQALGKRRIKMFGADSFLAKVTANTVTEEQRLKYESELSDRIRLRHRSNIEGAIRDIERNVVLRISQHEALVDLLLNEISPPVSLHEFDESLVKYQVSQLSRQKLQALIDADQWPKVVQIIEGFQDFKRHLIEQNLLGENSAAKSADKIQAAVEPGLPKIIPSQDSP